MFDSVQNNTWLFFRFFTVFSNATHWKGLEFLFLMNCLSRLYSLKNFKDLHMFFKELACFILFSYQCSFCLLIGVPHQQLVYIIMCCFVCQQLFLKNFFVLFPLFQRRLLKLNTVFRFCCCRVQQPWIIYPLCRKKSTQFFNFFPKRHFNQNTQLNFLFLCILHSISPVFSF